MSQIEASTHHRPSNIDREVRLERLRPRQIEAALGETSVVYMPLGTVEWHCHHLPVGLDALTAHGVCSAAAQRSGGVVYPPLYFGTGGDHGPYPWTVMMPTATHIESLVEFAAHRLDELGVDTLVLFSGHFAPEQVTMVESLAERWNEGQHSLRIRATSINQAEGTGIEPDHAGVFETTMLSALTPELIDLEQLDERADDGDRHDPDHPLWGVIGADPRAYDADRAAELLDRTADWLADFAQR